MNMIEGFHKAFSEDDSYYICYLQPTAGRWRDYLTVTYVLDAYAGPVGNMPMLYTICFDINTGQAVKLADVLPGDLDYSKSFVLPQVKPATAKGIFFENINYDNTIRSGHIPEAGSVITEAWVMDDRVNINVTEPDGHKLQYIFWEGL